MWTCGLLKTNARAALSGRYWKALGVCLVAMLLGVSSNSPNGFSLMVNLLREAESRRQPDVWTGNAYSAFSYEDLIRYIEYNGLLPLFAAVAAVALALALCWQIFLAMPLQVGRSRFFMESRQGYSPFSTLFSTLRAPYLNVVKVMLLTNLKIFLGSLIIVPGIIWSYSYVMVPYLLAENPYMSTSRAMELSNEMMMGEKWHVFVLGLSFIGWIILGILTFGIGLFLLPPYVQATYAELYAALRSKAFASGMTDSSELAGFMRY